MTIRHLKGRFLLTHTDQPEIRALFLGRGLSVEVVEPVYTAQQASGHGRKTGREVLITNY